jgi:hypothetical protein
VEVLVVVLHEALEVQDVLVLLIHKFPQVEVVEMVLTTELVLQVLLAVVVLAAELRVFLTQLQEVQETNP